MARGTGKNVRKVPADKKNKKSTKNTTQFPAPYTKDTELVPTTSERSEVQLKKENELPTAAPPAYQSLHRVHFDELNRIWDGDRRIPSAPSRKAWAQARNLNPVNVHSWWYRRRIHAKKLRITIPKGTYELEVGDPPNVPVEEEVKEEELPTANLLTNSDGTLVDADPTSDETVFNSGLEEPSELLKNGSNNKNRAYMHVSSPTRRRIRAECSPLPPSSPPRWSSPSTRSPSPEVFETPKLWYEEDFHEDIDISSVDYSFSSSDNAYLADYLGFDGTMTPPCASTHSDCLSGRTGHAGSGNDMNLDAMNLDAMNLDASWCISGFRVAFDGSVLGPCSACARDVS